MTMQEFMATDLPCWELISPSYSPAMREAALGIYSFIGMVYPSLPYNPSEIPRLSLRHQRVRKIAMKMPKDLSQEQYDQLTADFEKALSLDLDEERRASMLKTWTHNLGWP